MVSRTTLFQFVRLGSKCQELSVSKSGLRATFSSLASQDVILGRSSAVNDGASSRLRLR
jgi:hypothetical protein